MDPYTSNQVLREALRGAAAVDAAASYAAREAIPDIDYVAYLGEVAELVWSTDPWELHDRNAKMMIQGGANPEEVDSFLRQPLVQPKPPDPLGCRLRRARRSSATDSRAETPWLTTDG